MIEKRKSPRQRSFLRGFVYPGDQNYSMGCIVRDFSESGAKLRFKSPTSFTGKVKLHIPEKQKIILAIVVWVDNCEVGISFSAPVTLADPAPTDAASVEAELSDRMARLETEITALKELLKHLESHKGSKVKAA